MICDELETLAIAYLNDVTDIEIQDKLSQEDADKNRIIVECTKEADEIIGYTERLRLLITLRVQAGGEGTATIMNTAVGQLTNALAPVYLKPELTSSAVVCDGVIANEQTKDAGYPTLERPFSFTVFAHSIP